MNDELIRGNGSQEETISFDEERVIPKAIVSIYGAETDVLIFAT